MIKKKYLTGIQCSGKLHLGNILSVILPTIKLSEDNSKDVFIFLADLHTLTTIKNKETLNDNILYATAVLLACGLNPNKIVFYQQSQIKGICDLAWKISCLTPYPMLANSHAFKDKSKNLSDVNVGLFTYPVLMAADILIMKADYIIVGKDQKQHIEITRDIVNLFNKHYGETFPMPNIYINDDVSLIPGIDGRKMSKSYNNTIDIFADEEILKKQIFSIKTDSKKQNEPKNPNECIVFKIYSCLAEKKDINIMREKYINGTIGYKEAKNILLNLILLKFKQQRDIFNDIIKKKKFLKEIIDNGSKKAQHIIDNFHFNF